MRSGRGSAVAPPIAQGLRERLVAALRPSQGAARPCRALLELWGRSRALCCLCGGFVAVGLKHSRPKMCKFSAFRAFSL